MFIEFLNEKNEVTQQKVIVVRKNDGTIQIISDVPVPFFCNGNGLYITNILNCKITDIEGVNNAYLRIDSDHSQRE